MAFDDSRVFFVGQRITNHSDHSGYDRLIDQFPGSRGVEPLAWLPAKVLVLQAYRRVLDRRRPLSWYCGRDALREAAVAIERVRRRGSVFHFFYAESSLWLTSAVHRGRRNRIVASFHGPPSVLHAIEHRRFVRNLDAAIALGRRQRAFLAERIGDERAHFIPYGVDASYFTPANGDGERAPAERPRLLFVGHYLRDFQTLEGVVRALLERAPAARRPEITLVTDAASVPNVSALAGVRVATGLPEVELRALYRQADLLLLPLADCVANTAILESLACGTPVVASDVGDVSDYVTADCGRLVPGSAIDAWLEAIETLLTDRALLLRMRASARARGEELSWVSVGAQVRSLYESLFDGA